MCTETNNMLENVTYIVYKNGSKVSNNVDNSKNKAT